MFGEEVMRTEGKDYFLSRTTNINNILSLINTRTNSDYRSLLFNHDASHKIHTTMISSVILLTIMISSATLLTIALVLDTELLIAAFGLLVWRSHDLNEEFKDLSTDSWHIQQLSALVSIYVLMLLFSLGRIILGFVMHIKSPTKKKANYFLLPSIICLMLSIALVAAFKDSRTIIINFNKVHVKVYEAESPFGIIGIVFNFLFLIFGVCILKNLDRSSSRDHYPTAMTLDHYPTTTTLP